jgi:serine protease Do
MQGQVIGINTLIFSETGTSAGIGFAIPSNLATKVYAQLIKNGKVTRGYLGVSLQAISPSIARSVGYNGTEGALVADLPRDYSPAGNAGLRSGDVITEFEGKKVTSPKQLTEMVADAPVGKAAQLKYVREGHTETATVNLGERPPKDGEEAQPDKGTPEEQGVKLGVSISNLTPEAVRQLKIRNATGVIVQSVQPDSPAAEAGIMAGDVIHRINRVPVTNRQDYIRAMSALKGEKDITLLIERGGQTTYVSVSLD